MRRSEEIVVRKNNRSLLKAKEIHKKIIIIMVTY